MRIAPTPFPGDPAVTPQLVREHNLTDPEYERITTLLGRTPTFAELGVFSALWSEHCSYKHSRPVLKTRSEEHTSELQSQSNLVCRLLLEKKKYNPLDNTHVQIC